MAHFYSLVLNFVFFDQKQSKYTWNTWTAKKISLRAINSIFYAIAHISYGNSVLVSVLVSVTTRYQSEPRWDRDFWFSPYDRLGSLVFCDKISFYWVKGSPRMRGKRGAPPLENIILPLLALLTWKWLQIGTDMLLIITSTGNELLRNVNIDDLNDLEPPK